MLFELATGNVVNRMDTSSFEDLNEVIELLNTVAQKLENVVSANEYVTPFYSFQNSIKYSIILDRNQKIKNCNQALLEMLNYSATEIVVLNINDILEQQSLVLWEAIKLDIEKDEKYQETFPLKFFTKEELIVPLFCTISRHYFTNDIFINSITTIIQDIFDDVNFSLSNNSRDVEVQIIQKVYTFILNNLEEPLPSTKELSKQFGINEFNLKNNFKICFNTSIYKL
ncbi:hypothetical protein [Flavobacterium sp.]